MAKDQSMQVKLATLAVSFGAGLLAQKIVKVVWLKATGKPGSFDDDDDATIASIVGFAAVTGATAALTRALAARGTAKFAARLASRR